VSLTALPDEPVLFFKPPSALVAHGLPIRVPADVGRVDHEAELAAGVTALNDVSARVLQKKDGQFARAKGFDTFCPLGPTIALGLDPADLAVRARVNGATRQDGRSRDLAVSATALVAFIARVMTLEPGDVVSTGTPAGVSPIEPGDFVEIEIGGVGILGNPVVARA
jgi:2-keto-4-pentenoate hydratase/2-oxohepta-3-ene-1,7-dioic acid hydratase in catechol pathway